MTLETYIYRPLIRALTLIGAAVFGVLGGLTDFIADLISRKILSARKKKAPTSVGNVITRTIGGHAGQHGGRTQPHGAARSSD